MGIIDGAIDGSTDPKLKSFRKRLLCARLQTEENCGKQRGSPTGNAQLDAMPICKWTKERPSQLDFLNHASCRPSMDQRLKLARTKQKAELAEEKELDTFYDAEEEEDEGLEAVL